MASVFLLVSLQTNVKWHPSPEHKPMQLQGFAGASALCSSSAGPNLLKQMPFDVSQSESDPPKKKNGGVPFGFPMVPSKITPRPMFSAWKVSLMGFGKYRATSAEVWRLSWRSRTFFRTCTEGRPLLPCLRVFCITPWECTHWVLTPFRHISG